MATLIAGIAVLVPMFVLDVLLNPDAGVAEGSLLSNPLLEEAALLLTVAVTLPAVWLGVRVVEGRSLGWVSSVRGRLRWRWLALTAVPIVPLVILGFAAFVGVGVLVEPATGEAASGSVDWFWVIAGLAVIVLLVPVQAAAEEYFFRGFLMQWIGGYLRNPLFGVAITSVVFALAHADLQLPRLASLTAFGAVAGLLALHTGGLEASIVLHTVNNLLAFGLGTFTGPPPTADISDTAMPWWMAAVDISMLVLVLAAVLLLARRRRIDRVMPPAATSQPPAAPPTPPAPPVTEPSPQPVGAG